MAPLESNGPKLESCGLSRIQFVLAFSSPFWQLTTHCVSFFLPTAAVHSPIFAGFGYVSKGQFLYFFCCETRQKGFAGKSVSAFFKKFSKISLLLCWIQLEINLFLGGGFKYFLFSPILGDMTPLDEHIF